MQASLWRKEISTFSFPHAAYFFYTESNNFFQTESKKTFLLAVVVFGTATVKPHWPGAHSHGLQPSADSSSKDHTASIWISIVTIQKWKPPFFADGLEPGRRQAGFGLWSPRTDRLCHSADPAHTGLHKADAPRGLCLGSVLCASRD